MEQKAADESWDEELERVIAALVARKDAAAAGSAEHQMAVRQLRGLRYTYENAGPIIEDLDPDGWGSYCSPL
jgi:hypothetical protein